MAMIDMTVNGVQVQADVDDRTTLADFLRAHADARSVHLGCEHGVCGACTIVIDGQIARSCIALAVALNGAEIQTLEGLAGDPLLETLRANFHEYHGLQCGYCTPGMLVTARDIVSREAAADEQAIREQLAGNICRCTGYSGIVKAIQKTAEQILSSESTV